MRRYSVYTNPKIALTREMVIYAVRVRWQGEEFHRSFKQLTGAEKCQCRKASAQRNHWPGNAAAWRGCRSASTRMPLGKPFTRYASSNGHRTCNFYSKIPIVQLLV